jgi:hypothetical protein
MTQLNFFLACFFTCLSLTVTAQEEEKMAKWDASYSDGIKYREILMNVTPLIGQFVPFNASTLSRFNIFDFEYRRLKNGKGWRWSLGVNVSGDFNASEPQGFYTRFGLVKKRQISNRFHFVRSWDISFLAEDPEVNSPTKGKLGFSGLGLSYSAGIEYRITKQIALSTEGLLLLGLLPTTSGNDFGTIRFIPPVGLFFHVRF